jgi:hypothetical protein
VKRRSFSSKDDVGVAYEISGTSHFSALGDRQRLQSLERNWLMNWFVGFGPRFLLVALAALPVIIQPFAANAQTE